jgi:hypothetical protein
VDDHSPKSVPTQTPIGNNGDSSLGTYLATLDSDFSFPLLTWVSLQSLDVHPYGVTACAAVHPLVHLNGDVFRKWSQGSFHPRTMQADDFN